MPWKLFQFSFWQNGWQNFAKNLPLFSWFSNYYPGHTPASEMTYIVSGAALNSTHSLRAYTLQRTQLI